METLFSYWTTNITPVRDVTEEEAKALLDAFMERYPDLDVVVVKPEKEDDCRG